MVEVFLLLERFQLFYALFFSNFKAVVIQEVLGTQKVLIYRHLSKCAFVENEARKRSHTFGVCIIVMRISCLLFFPIAKIHCNTGLVDP